MIAVTGANGLLGTHLLEQFRMEGHAAIGIVRNVHQAPQDWRKGDILDPDSLLEALKGIDTVIHAAAMVSFNPGRREEILETNVQGTANVVNACLEAGVGRLIHISSIAAVGRVEGTIISEDSPWTGENVSDYAESKYLAELEVFRGAEEGLEVSMVNPSMVLTGSQPGRSSAALLDYIWKGSVLYPTGHINFVDVRDVAAAVAMLAHQPQQGERFILSAGSLPYKEFFSQVALRLQRPAPRYALSRSTAWLAGLASEFSARLTGKEPALTRLSAMMASNKYVYSHQKAATQLGLRFRTLEETLDWCCADYLRNVAANS